MRSIGSEGRIKWGYSRNLPFNLKEVVLENNCTQGKPVEEKYIIEYPQDGKAFEKVLLWPNATPKETALEVKNRLEVHICHEDGTPVANTLIRYYVKGEENVTESGRKEYYTDSNGDGILINPTIKEYRLYVFYKNPRVQPEGGNYTEMKEFFLTVDAEGVCSKTLIWEDGETKWFSLGSSE